MLELKEFSIRRGHSLLIEEATVTLYAGQKVSLTGANGSGKSSLFAAILGELLGDTGSIKISDDWLISHVAQEAPADQRSALDHVLDGDAEWRSLQRLLKDTEAPNFSQNQARFEEIDGYSANSRAAQLLHGLGFADEDMHRPAAEFSGGWRVRLNLARALMCRSDLLLLDEPTNHLDLDAVLWLERWLKHYSGTLLLIAHDRDFLDNVTQHTLNLEHCQLRLYQGNYSAFERIRSELLARQTIMQGKQQKAIEHMQDFVRRFQAKASKARQAQSRLKALKRLQMIEPAHVDSAFAFTIPKPLKNPSPLFSMHDVAVGYADTPVLDGIELCVRPGDRFGLVGPNGAGKSTLIKLLAGELQPTSGNIHRAKNLQIGYFAQHQIEQLQMQHNAIEHLQLLQSQLKFEEATESQLRKYLGSFGFVGDKALRPVGSFSGGEKSRLALALLCYQRPNLLLLDEPTNHLDLDMRRALAVALQAYEGAVILVSHDRHLLKLNADNLILVAAGRAKEFSGSVDDYPQWLAEQTRGASATNDSTQKASTKTLRKQQKREEAKQRQQLQPWRKKVAQYEELLKRLERKQTEIDDQLNEPDIYADENKDRLIELLKKQGETKTRVEETEADWLKAMEALEVANDDSQGDRLGE